jgi:hypothetical protein
VTNSVATRSSSSAAASRGAVLRSDAVRYHSIYGISVVAARDVTVDELAQQPPLIRFDAPTLVEAGLLRAAGLRLEPTGQNRRHFTVAFDDPDKGVEALGRCEHVVWENPYQEE